MLMLHATSCTAGASGHMHLLTPGRRRPGGCQLSGHTDARAGIPDLLVEHAVFASARLTPGECWLEAVTRPCAEDLGGRPQTRLRRRVPLRSRLDSSAAWRSAHAIEPVCEVPEGRAEPNVHPLIQERPRPQAPGRLLGAGHRTHR
jgi:hypothetical protein